MIVRTSVDPKVKVVNGVIKAEVECITVNEFNEASAKKLAEEVAEIVDGGQGIVPVIIDSFGGEIYALLSMFDTLRSCGVPVLTYARGKAMSCGCILLAAGHKGMRFASPHSTIMLHEGAMWAAGKTADLKADVSELERLEKIIFGLLDEKGGKKKGHYRRLIKKAQRADLYLSPVEARKNGLIDHVGVPSFSIDVTCAVGISWS